MCRSVSVSYFVAGDFVAAAGDAFGDGLTTGLAAVAGAGVVAVAGVAVSAAGVVVPGVLELFTGSAAQPAAKVIEKIAISKSALRLKVLSVELVISFASFEQD